MRKIVWRFNFRGQARGYRKRYKKALGRNCYNCYSKIWSSQCGYTGDGIGNGEQGEVCRDYTRTRLGKWIKSFTNRK